VAGAAAGALAAASIILTAAAAPVRLLDVSAHDNAVLIESTEPVPYIVSRPDPLTLLVDLRNVSISLPAADLPGSGQIAGVKVEQRAASDGTALARIRVSMRMASEYRVRSARNTIRVELTPAPGAPRPAAARSVPGAQTGGRTHDAGPATTIEHVRTRRTPSSTTITLSGNGQLLPSRVAESAGDPRHLTFDFPEVTSTTGSRIEIDSLLVKNVRLAVSSREPLVTRVVMELGSGATYRVGRSGPAGRDLDVVFHGRTASSDRDVPGPPAATGASPIAERPVTMEQAILNAAAITPQFAMPPEPITALDVTPALAAQGPGSATAASGREASPPSPVLEPLPGAPGTTLQQIGGGDGPKRFTGHPVSLDFQGADLRAVLRGFSEISGLNMVIDPDVQGTVDIILNEVPWDQALDVILRGNQLDYTVDGTIVRIARLESLRKEQDSRQALIKAAADAGTLSVRTFALSYAQASAAAPLIKKAALSARGDVQIDDRTNTLIVTDLPARLDTVMSLLATLDRPERQVEIEARVVTTTREFARAIGVQWGLNGRMTPELGNTTNLAFPNQGTLSGRLDDRGTAVGLGETAATSAIGLALGAVNGAFSLDIALTALERSGKGRILSTPRITTQNNVEAEITQGVQIPVQTVANNTTTTTYVDAALTLKVLPQITNANTVIMQIELVNGSPGQPVPGGIPIDTQRAITRVQVADGMTTVMGGIFITREQSSMDKTPLLHRVPLLGWLFRHNDESDESRELLIFITPRILKG
jgi:type IV pilus assembly protein PilQ